MINKYLSKNPLDWMLEKEDPSIRYNFLKEINEESNLDNEYDILINSDEIRDFLNSSKNGILGDRKKFDIFYRGSMWYFAEAVEKGLDIRTDIIRKTAEYIIETTQLPSGGFTLNWSPAAELSCRTGDMIRSLIKSGYRGASIDLGIRWIIENQRHDGGWLHCPISGFGDSFKLMMFKTPGNGLKRENNNVIKSCIYATASCTMALLEYSRREGKLIENIAPAAEFFLRQKIYLNRNNQPVITKKYWNRDFRLLGYPVLSQYDVLYGLLIVAKAGRMKDQRSGKAFNLVMSKQNQDGTWNLENAQTGMLFGDGRAPIGKKNKWVTLNILRMLKYADI